MSFNVEPNFDPSLPYWVDLVAIWVEEPPEYPCEYCWEKSAYLDEWDRCPNCTDSLSDCCGSPYIWETTLCSDCKDYG